MTTFFSSFMRLLLILNSGAILTSVTLCVSPQDIQTWEVRWEWIPLEAWEAWAHRWVFVTQSYRIKKHKWLCWWSHDSGWCPSAPPAHCTPTLQLPHRQIWCLDCRFMKPNIWLPYIKSCHKTSRNVKTAVYNQCADNLFFSTEGTFLVLPAS